MELSTGAANVLLITIDSLRVDRLGCYGYQKNTSPNIDKIASKGVLFRQAITNGHGTPEAFPSILASALPPADHNEYMGIIQDKTTIAEVLRNQSYRTAAFHSNPYLSKLFHYDKGFDVFEDSLKKFDRLQKRQVTGMVSNPDSLLFTIMGKFLSLFSVSGPPILRAEEINAMALRWLKSQNSRFFLWLHYMDVHHPYWPPQKYISQFCHRRVNRYRILALARKMVKSPDRLTDDERQTLNDLYDACISYTDESIGLLLREITEELPNTVVIITADHGDEFGEHGTFSHLTVYDGVLRVPLIIYGPGLGEGVVVKGQVGLMDIAPTIVDLLNLRKVPGFHGKSLLPVIRGGEVGGEGVISVSHTFPREHGRKRTISYRAEGWKYIRTNSLDGLKQVTKRELYDLENDPAERKNLYSEKSERVERFEAEIAKYLSRAEKERVRKMVRRLGGRVR